MHFRKSMAELGLTVPAPTIVEGDHTMEGGKAAMEKLLAQADLPTAVICSNDMTAIGVLHALDETTHKVPADISVVGFDDIHLAQFMLPPLTTVRMSCKDLAEAAVRGVARRHRAGPPAIRAEGMANRDAAGGAAVNGLSARHVAGLGNGAQAR